MEKKTKKCLYDLLDDYPEFVAKFIAKEAAAIDLVDKMEVISSDVRLDLRDRFKIVVLNSRFPGLLLKQEVWSEILRFNGHYTEGVTTWINALKDVVGVGKLESLFEIMFASKIKFHRG